jgi:hypothetical protein
MEGAKAAVASCELPTGFRISDKVVTNITFREMAGPEEDILASNMAVSQKLSTIMANCTRSIGEVSEYNQIKKMMDEMVISDRWFYLVQLRILSLGADYRFLTKCPACQHEDKVVFDLREVKVKNAPKADALYRDLTLPSGQTVRIKVADGVSDAKIEKMANESNAPTIGLYVRISELNGSPVDLADVKQMTMRDRAFIRQAVEEHEGQLDESFQASCPKCGHSYEGEMQLDGRTFFSP